MGGTGLNESALKQEINEFLRQVELTRSRTVLNTKRAEEEFSKAAYGFRSVLNELTHGLTFPDSVNACEGFRVAVYKLGRDAMGVYSPDEPEGAAALAAIDGILPAEEISKEPAEKGFVTIGERNTARETIKRYAEATIGVIAARMIRSGIDVDAEDLNDWLNPLMNRIAPMAPRFNVTEPVAGTA